MSIKFIWTLWLLALIVLLLYVMEPQFKVLGIFIWAVIKFEEK